MTRIHRRRAGRDLNPGHTAVGDMQASAARDYTNIATEAGSFLVSFPLTLLVTFTTACTTKVQAMIVSPIPNPTKPKFPTGLFMHVD